MTSITRQIGIATALLMLGAATGARADEISVLSASAVKTVLTDLAEAYRREGGKPVKLTFATAGEVEKRVLAGDAADVIVGTDLSTEKLAGQGLLQADTRAVIARVGVGVGAREGAPKPDISSPDALIVLSHFDIGLGCRESAILAGSFGGRRQWADNNLAAARNGFPRISTSFPV